MTKTSPDPTADQSLASDPRRADLRADCANCFGLCCVALAFSASTDFPIDKAAGQPCPNLSPQSRCGVHADLRERGFAGCAAYDCLGAGQQVSRVTFGGQDWRADPSTARSMFAVFPVMRQLHELRWHLGEALALRAARPLRAELRRALADAERLAQASPEELLALDLGARWREAGDLLLRASELARTEIRRAPPDRRGADLAGADLRRADLRAASLRGACLIAANLAGVDLRGADLLGADLRDADLRGANLAGSLFLTPSQLGAASGDAATRLPAALDRPGHWA